LSNVEYKIKRNLLGVQIVQYACSACGADLENQLRAAGQPDHCPVCSAEHIVPGKAEREAKDRQKRERIEKHSNASQSPSASKFPEVSGDTRLTEHEYEAVDDQNRQISGTIKAVIELPDKDKKD